VYSSINRGGEQVELITCSFTTLVQEQVDELPEGLIKKIEAYKEILKMKGHHIALPYADKIEGYNNLFELRPGFHNIEYRMIFFWQGNHAQFVNSFTEKGKKKENRREYSKAGQIKPAILDRGRI
jgi:hypothetical protein